MRSSYGQDVHVRIRTSSPRACILTHRARDSSSLAVPTDSSASRLEDSGRDPWPRAPGKGVGGPVAI